MNHYRVYYREKPSNIIDEEFATAEDAWRAIDRVRPGSTNHTVKRYQLEVIDVEKPVTIAPELQAVADEWRVTR